MRLSFLSFAALAASALSTQAADLAGYDRLDVRADHRAYPIAASVWYPAGHKTYAVPIGNNPIFRGTPAFVGAGIADGTFPLVLFSHGSGGNMDTSAWLSSELANQGVMVLSVNHPGSTSGDSSPRRSVRLDERAADLSAALDALLADPAFAPHVDTSRITSVGFSLGGATALGLAGIRFDAAGYAPYCDSGGPALADCLFFSKGDVDFSNLPDGFSADARDPRVTSAIAIDPAFSYVVTDESIAALKASIGLINLGDEDRLKAADVSPEGSGLVQRLNDASFAVVSPANHFSFLAPCKPMGAALLEEEGDDPVCTDPDMTDREKVHRQIAAEISNMMGL